MTAVGSRAAGGGIPEEPVLAEVRECAYGDRIGAVEPGGAEFIPLADRHGAVRQLFGTWTARNLEFATVFVGVIAISFFGQSFWQVVAATLVGTALGSVTHGRRSTRGPAFGVPQGVLSRISFGNILPAGLNAVAAGVGWFAVKSVSGALALNALTGLLDWLCLTGVSVAQVTTAFFGHNLVQLRERLALPLLGAASLVASVVILSRSHPGSMHATCGVGGFLLTVAAAFGYAAGWNPYAADYTRHLAPITSRVATRFWAGFGVFASCAVLEVVGAAFATIPGGSSTNPTTAFTNRP